MDPFPGILDVGSDKEFPSAKEFYEKWRTIRACSGFLCSQTIRQVKNRTQSRGGTTEPIRPVPFPGGPAIHCPEWHETADRGWRLMKNPLLTTGFRKNSGAEIPRYQKIVIQKVFSLTLR
jgi:hypothetical protein